MAKTDKWIDSAMAKGYDLLFIVKENNHGLHPKQ